MPWQIIQMRLTYHKPNWRLLTSSLILLLTIFTLIHVASDMMVKCKSCVSIRLFHKREVKLDFNYEKYLNMTWKSKQEAIPLLTMFTTWNPSMQKPVVYTNAVKNWHSLSQNVRTIAFTNDSEIETLAREGGWLTLPIRETACFGTPILRSMFRQAMDLPTKSKLYAYVNADLVFNDGLVKTLKEITKSPYFEKGPILVVGKRIDVNISRLHEPEINSTGDVDGLAKHGNISWGFAADYYITNELFPWEFVPNLVIGRPLIDNWLIWYARQIGAKVIDITGTVLAVHQLANGLKRIHFMCNKAVMWKSGLLPNTPIWKGMIECASFETKYNSKGDVIILPKLIMQHICKHDEVVFH